MSRVDVPTLKCDRCGRQTQDVDEMIHWPALVRSRPDSNRWDLCSMCWMEFANFMTRGAGA